MDFFFWCSLYVVSTMCVIIYATPWFAIALIPITTLYFLTVRYFQQVNREAKRLESVARSPVYAQFSETLGGLTTIRAFDSASRFVSTNVNLVDQSIRAFYVMKSSDRWLSVRLELIGAFIALCASLMAVVQTILENQEISKLPSSSSLNATTPSGMATAGTAGSNDEFASIAGLSLSFAIGVTGLLNWTVRCSLLKSFFFWIFYHQNIYITVNILHAYIFTFFDLDSFFLSLFFFSFFLFFFSFFLFFFSFFSLLFFTKHNRYVPMHKWKQG